MTSLTNAAIFFKKAFVFIVIAAVCAILIFFVVLLGKKLYSAVVPPKPHPETVAFGKLPQLDLSEGISPPQNISFNVETISAELPKLEASVKVFRVAQDESSFGQLERSKIIVSRIGFGKVPEVVGNIARFIDPKNEKKTITFNIASGNFRLESNFLDDEKLVEGRVRSTEEAIRIAKNFFDNFDVSGLNLFENEAEVIKLKVEDGNLAEALSLGDANLIRVNFKRNNIDGLPVLSPYEKGAPAWAMVVGDRVVAAELLKLGIRYHQFATYPLKGTQKAFEDLKNKKAVLNKIPQPSSFAIRDVNLAYLETKNNQGYLLPVYVFRGDDGLVAYVSAVDDKWIQ